jgi:hypothetical protein
MNLMSHQGDATPKRGLPVDVKNSSPVVTSITGETVQLKYFNGAVLTNDAGQAAGVAVVAQLANGGVKNILGSTQASKSDTSLAFTSTALTAEVDFDWRKLEQVDYATLKERLEFIVKDFTNGQYCVDYTNGVIYAKKASTGATLTACSYKVEKLGVDATVTVPPITIEAAKTVSPDGGTTTLYAASDAAGVTKVFEQANLVKVAYDYIGVVWTVGTFTEVFTYKTGGSGGATVATVTVVYSSATKAQVVSVART